MITMFRSNAETLDNHVSVLYETMTTKQGLSANTVNTVVQDQQGFIWIGTDDGLNRFDGYSIVNYNIAKYLNSNSASGCIIKTLMVDKYGIIWIGTVGGGLLQFDPQKEKFVVYNTERKDNSTSSNDVFSVIEDSRGHIWVGTYGGGLNLVTRDHRTAFFRYFYNNPKDVKSISSNNVRCIAEISNGDIFIGTEDNGVNIIRNSCFGEESNNIEFIRVPLIDENGHPFYGAVMSIVEDKNHDIWVATWGSGLFRYSTDKNGNAQFFRYPEKMLGNVITSLYCDDDNNLWIGSWGNGLYKIDKDRKCAPFWAKSMWSDNRVRENKIWTIFKDRNNILWLGTDEGGLSRFNMSSQKFASISNAGRDGQILSDNEVQCFAELPTGEVLIGTRSGGIDKYNPETGTIEKFPTPDGIAILSMLCEDDILWIGTDGDGLIEYKYKTGAYNKYAHLQNDTTSLSNNAVFAIHRDRNENLWIGTWGGGFSKFNAIEQNFQNIAISKDNLGQNVVIDIDEDSKGNLWMATFGLGLLKYSPETQRMIYYKHETENPNSISSNTLRQVYIDRFDNVWIGMNSNGLDKFDVKMDKFEHFTFLNGFYSKKVEALLADSLNNIWLTTNNGISKISSDGISIFNYGLDDGLQDVEYCVGSIFCSSQGKMFTGGINGMNIFNPYIIQNDTVLPTILVTDIKLNNCSVEVGKEINGIVVLRQSVSYAKNINISHKEKILSFEFSSLDYAPNNTTRFAYKLEGFDDEWVYTTSDNRVAHYSNLSPGEYTFCVKGSNSDDVWNNDGVKIGITIDPPFWRAWWFYVALVMVTIIIVYSIISVRIKSNNHHRVELQKLVEIRTQTVNSQKSVLEQRLEELKDMNKELEKKNEEIQLQSEVVLTYVQEIERGREEATKQKNEIIESLMYARRIQLALLPSKQFLKTVLKDYFLFFKPRDIVSGDYYWVAEKDERIIIVVADCTGHGVPGAFMSLLGISYLNEIVNRETSLKANEILNQVRYSVISSLNNQLTSSESRNQDGMDMSLCIIDRETRTIQYAGANNPMYWFDKGELKTIQADKMPIGLYIGEQISFTCKMFEYEPGDTIYMFSDGYVDQFGGPKGKTFKSHRFRDMLQNIQGETMQKQNSIIKQTFNSWMSENPDVHNNFQVDDVLVLGVRLD